MDTRAPVQPLSRRVVDAVIELSIAKRVWLLCLLMALLAYMAFHARLVKVDALPDLSETQVILKGRLDGAPPNIVEDQVTYPATSELLGISGAKAVRAFSMFGESFIYVVFHDGIEPATARARVTERLPLVNSRMPKNGSVVLGPDASGTGWVYQYALTSEGGVGVESLRALQDFTLRRELQSVEGVAEVATFGGAPRQLQIEISPERLIGAGVTPADIVRAVQSANQARGGGAMQLGRERFFISSDARLKPEDDLSSLPVKAMEGGSSVRLGQVARASMGPAPVEGVGHLAGYGEVVGGVVVMRQGEKAYDVSHRVRAKLAELEPSLPKGVKLIQTYDRSGLIERAVQSLGARLLEEAAVVGIVCALFLGRLRSAIVAVVTIPAGLVAAVAILKWQGVTANIMSLGGLAIAIGAMVDASVVMVEALHRKLEGRRFSGAEHWSQVRACAKDVGPALFFSLLVITVSFLPVFSLEGQEGRLFGPLALTKTYAMAAAAALSISLVPVLMGLFIRGPVGKEVRNPLNRLLKNAYRPALKLCLRRPNLAVALSAVVSLSAAVPLTLTGTEFMPALDEGDLLYMPTVLPSVSVEEAKDILRRTDELIAAEPEVAYVHGKAGRSDSATDPAPMSMIETVIALKPRSQWPHTVSTEELIQRLQEKVRLAGLVSSWGYPVRTRMDMLSTGVKTPLALKVTGPTPAVVQQIAEAAEVKLRGVPGIESVITERANQGRFIDVEFNRRAGAVYGVTASDVAELLEGPVGGMPFDVITHGRGRIEIALKVPKSSKESIAALSGLRLRAMSGAVVELGQVARITLRDGPTEVRSENARAVAYVLLNTSSGDSGAVLAEARRALEGIDVPSGYSTTWVGQYLRLGEAKLHLALMSVATLALVLLILFFHFGNWRQVLIVAASLPVAAAGGVWLNYALGFRWSFATVVGLIALAGLAAEFCVVMLLYLDQALETRAAATPQQRRAAVIAGALLRLRPKSMTVAVILGGLLPVMFSDGVGVDVMSRIAAPMVGGMLTAPLFALLAVPAIVLWLENKRAARGALD